MPDPTQPSFDRHFGTLADRPIGITTYKVGNRFSCRIDNVDPGAIIARASGATREEAIESALASAALSLKLQHANDALRRTVEQLGSPKREPPSNKGSR